MKITGFCGLAIACALSGVCSASQSFAGIAALCDSGRATLIRVEHSQLTEEDEVVYFSDKATRVEYGQEKLSNTPFIAINGKRFLLRDISFKKIATDEMARFSDDQFPIMLAEFYKFSDHATTRVCIVSDFGGLGQSGRFQAVRWAVAFPVGATTISDIGARFGR